MDDLDLANCEEAFNRAAHRVAECAAGVVVNTPNKSVTVNGEEGFPVDAWTLTKLVQALAAYDQAAEDLQQAKNTETASNHEEI